MEPILHIRSSFRSYTMSLIANNKPVFFTQYQIASYAHKSEELQSSSVTNTMQLIQYAQNNGINSFGVEMQGPLGFSLLSIELLNANGIDVMYIKDKTPVPHNGCYPLKRAKIKKL